MMVEPGLDVVNDWQVKSVGAVEITCRHCGWKTAAVPVEMAVRIGSSHDETRRAEGRCREHDAMYKPREHD